MDESISYLIWIMICIILGYVTEINDKIEQIQKTIVECQLNK